MIIKSRTIEIVMFYFVSGLQQRLFVHLRGNKAEKEKENMAVIYALYDVDGHMASGLKVPKL